ncbi:hypothetical protein N9B17_07430 [Rhodopirellula sp.]|nr:hypothetical protein [Rhodopirellula sp.]
MLRPITAAADPDSDGGQFTLVESLAGLKRLELSSAATDFISDTLHDIDTAQTAVAGRAAHAHPMLIMSALVGVRFDSAVEQDPRPHKLLKTGQTLSGFFIYTYQKSHHKFTFLCSTISSC